MRIRFALFFLLFVLFSCTNSEPLDSQLNKGMPPIEGISIEVLGVAQDAGYPQADCEKSCCKNAWDSPEKRRHVVSLALYDPHANMRFMFEASPDFPQQLEMTKRSLFDADLAGVFLTHAHIGHYTGLMFLGHEAMGAENVPVYAMPRMKKFLEENGPWDQLVRYENIKIQELKHDSLIGISDSLFIRPLLVPHRDEYSETVAYVIYGPSKKAIFLPDIDKWGKWEASIVDWIKEVDYAFLDASFYDGDELPGRDMSQIPHPFVIESMELFQDLSEKDKAKVHFIHFNHTNPLLQANSPQTKKVEEAGFKIAREGMRLKM